MGLPFCFWCFMNEILKNFFEKEKIEFYASAEILPEFVISQRRLPQWARFVTVFLIPYDTKSDEKRNISRYAVSGDYHLFAKKLENDLKMITDKKLCVFADTSPFDERKLACCLSLGFVGKNGLLINEKYGSFVFVGEIVTEEKVSLQGGEICKRQECLGCGKCLKSCPTGAISNGENCISEITQKKKISPEEETLIRNHNLLWGCDICQEVCPHNIDAAPTQIDFFYKDRLPYITARNIEKMSDEEFSARAYSWRGRNVIMRNLSLKL